MMLRTAIPLLFALGLFLGGCAHGPLHSLGVFLSGSSAHEQSLPEFQDMSVQLPVFDSELKPDADLDGQTLQAIRIAANGFLREDPKDDTCANRQSSHRYRVLRQGSVIFVRIDFVPERCARKRRPLDGGATYAVSAEGRLLRRNLDGIGDW